MKNASRNSSPNGNNPPPELKSGIEAASGLSLDGAVVHRNSDEQEHFNFGNTKGELASS